MSTPEPMYGWALDAQGRPIPIAAASRGAQGYRCPICNGAMIARKGDVNQHHFAHESLYHCTPENVAAVIAGKWLVMQLAQRMVLKKTAMVGWALGDQSFEGDILKDVVAIVENQETDYGKADIALIGADGKPKTVINIASPEATTAFASHGITVINPPIDAFRSGQMDLDGLLKASEVIGGWRLLSIDGELQTEPAKLREILQRMVTYPPFQFWGKLGIEGPYTDVIRFGEYLLWLSPEIWQITIGGSINRLGPDLVVTIQEWPQANGSVVVLFYVVLRDKERAIAVRRFAHPDEVHARLSAAFRMRQVTVEDVARWLATS